MQRQELGIVIAGPVALPTPPGCERIDVESAAEMHQSVLQHLGEASFAVMAAAVADYRPAHAAASKLTKRDGLPQLSRAEPPDILPSAAAHKGDRVLVGFAAETDDLEANGRRKLQSKGCDLMVANPVGGATGFDTELNQGMLLAADGSVQRLGPMSKAEMSGRILDEAIRLRKPRQEIHEETGDWTTCLLHKVRNAVVFGSRKPAAKLVFIGEGPGADEDAQGLPFVGRAGQLLTRMIDGTCERIGLAIRRPDVYICNVVKCRPPDNRAPELDEMEICGQFLFRQVKAICRRSGGHRTARSACGRAQRKPTTGPGGWRRATGAACRSVRAKASRRR